MCGEKRIRKKTIVIGKSEDADLELIREQLGSVGIDLDDCCGGGEGGRVKIVCISPDLKNSVEEMGSAPRDRVLMVRVDEATSASLDAWVESGAVRSRSEAAALFIREGLKVRSSELDQLRDALSDLEQAKSRLRKKAQEVFGEEADSDA